ncbi:MAG: helix-turn-helix domain-containing protein [Methylovirgula sp.]
MSGASRWARDLLAKGNARVGEIGFSIGYGSEAAFSRAYKALFGHSPRVESKLRQRYCPQGVIAQLSS